MELSIEPPPCLWPEHDNDENEYLSDEGNREEEDAQASEEECAEIDDTLEGLDRDSRIKDECSEGRGNLDAIMLATIQRFGLDSQSPFMSFQLLLHLLPRLQSLYIGCLSGSTTYIKLLDAIPAGKLPAGL